LKIMAGLKKRYPAIFSEIPYRQEAQGQNHNKLDNKNLNQQLGNKTLIVGGFILMVMNASMKKLTPNRNKDEAKKA